MPTKIGYVCASPFQDSHMRLVESSTKVGIIICYPSGRCGPTMSSLMEILDNDTSKGWEIIAKNDGLGEYFM